jgi:hypothetical protein
MTGKLGQPHSDVSASEADLAAFLERGAAVGVSDRWVDRKVMPRITRALGDLMLPVDPPVYVLRRPWARLVNDSNITTIQAQRAEDGRHPPRVQVDTAVLGLGSALGERLTPEDGYRVTFDAPRAITIEDGHASEHDYYRERIHIVPVSDQADESQ